MRRDLRMATVLSLSYFISTAFSQGFLSAIPQCYQDCLQSSGDFTCNGLDIPCLCRLSNGNFITKLITCIKSNCDNNLNVTELVGPAAEVCAARGVSIAPEVVSSAQNIGSSLVATPIRTFTGATTLTSSYASAGTRYVVVVPLSASRGRSGAVQTITGPTRTILAASITGGGRAPSGSGTDQEGGSSSSSSASSTSTVTAVNTVTSTAITSSSSSPASSTSTGTAVNTVTSTAVAPGSSSPSSRGGSAAANTNNQDGNGGDGSRQGGDGTPFTSEGSLFRHSHYGCLGIGVCLAVLFAAL